MAWEALDIARLPPRIGPYSRVRPDLRTLPPACARALLRCRLSCLLGRGSPSPPLLATDKARISEGSRKAQCADQGGTWSGHSRGGLRSIEPGGLSMLAQLESASPGLKWSQSRQSSHDTRPCAFARRSADRSRSSPFHHSVHDGGSACAGQSGTVSC